MAGQTPAERTANNDVDYDLGAPRSAGLLIEVFPIGKPGTVGWAVHNTGPQSLTRDEAAHLLRAAAERLRRSTTWRG